MTSHMGLGELWGAFSFGTPDGSWTQLSQCVSVETQNTYTANLGYEFKGTTHQVFQFTPHYRFVQYWLVSVVWDLSFGVIGLENDAWDSSFGNFRW